MFPAIEQQDSESGPGKIRQLYIDGQWVSLAEPLR
jgi:hypothetical protein